MTTSARPSDAQIETVRAQLTALLANGAYVAGTLTALQRVNDAEPKAST